MLGACAIRLSSAAARSPLTFAQAHRLPDYAGLVDPIEALHTAARMYGGHVEPVDHDLPDADERNDIVVMIGNFVELYTPDSFTSLEEARETLAWLATTYIPQQVARENTHDYFWKWGMGGVWRGEWSPETLDEVLTGFADYVRAVPAEELSRFPFEPLAFQRTLTEAQTVEAFDNLRARWGITGFYWYPLDREEAADPPPHTVAFDAAPFGEEEDAPELLRLVLDELGVTRALQLSEPPEPDREIALEWVEFDYRGSETIVTDGSFDWVVYASHEDSVAVAGERLLSGLQVAWPSWDEWTTWKDYW